MSTDDSQSKSKRFKLRNLFWKEDSIASARDVKLGKFNKSSKTNVIPLKTTGVRVPGNHRRESYILQTGIKEARGPVKLNRVHHTSRDWQWKSSPALRRAKIAPSIHGQKSKNNCELGHRTQESNSVKKNAKTSDSKKPFVVKISVVPSLIAMCFHTVACILTSWMSAEFSEIGLWEICIVQICGYYKTDSTTTVIRAGQGTNILGYVVGVVAVLLIFYNMFCSSTTHDKSTRLAAMIAAFLAAGLILLGVIIIGTADEFQSMDVGWAMILAIIGAILYIITGVLMTIGLVQTRTP